MRFTVIRSSGQYRDDPPCEEGTWEDIPWGDGGVLHERIVTFDTLEQLAEFVHKYGQVILADSPIPDVMQLEIYDAWRET